MILDNFKNNINIYNKPKHVAIIMDGNGRWANKHGELRVFGHKAGVKSVKRAIDFAILYKINVLTLYAFSSENWNRPLEEVNNLIKIFTKTLDKEIYKLNKYKIKLKIIGNIKKFNDKLQKKIFFAEEITKNNLGLKLNLAMNYGGRWDITECVKKIAYKIKKGTLCPDSINENTLCKYICLNKLDPVDLVIRTGGEYRISNFLLWQVAYAEFYFTDILWPDFNKKIFEKAIISFSKRKRKFGKIQQSNAKSLY